MSLESSPLAKQILRLARRRGIIRPCEVKALGLPTRYLRQLEQEGQLLRLDRGLYACPETPFSSQISLLEVAKRVPRGVICLISALRFHDLTLEFAPEAWVAVPPGHSHPKMENLRVRYFHFSGQAFSEGVEVHRIDGMDLKVYSAAKTVADCFKFRNVVGLDVAIQALKQGWEERRFDPPELMRFARMDRVENVIRPYLDVVLQ